MENIHVRLEYPEALKGKRDFLSLQLNLLNLLKKLKNYKVERKRELIIKAKLKNQLSLLKAQIRNLGTLLPSEEAEKQIKKKPKKKTGTVGKRSNIEQQLREIQDKLANLQ